MYLFPFRFSQLCLAPDAGGGMGGDAAPNTDPAQEPAQEPEKPAEAAAAQDPPAAEGQPAAQTENPPAQEGLKPAAASGGNRQAERRESQGAKGDHASSPEPDDAPDPAKQLEAAQQRIMTAELRSAAALAGVPKERIPYVLRLADTTGIDLNANDAGEKIEAAIGKVLTDLPELRGSAGGTGSTGNFARKTGEAEDPDMARIRKNILG